MKNNLKNRILNGWGVIRVLRLGLGLIVSYFAFSKHDWMLGLLGAILLMQAFLNAMCCGPVGCETDQSLTKRRSYSESPDDITFKEVK
jgi:hypothetical protein